MMITERRLRQIVRSALEEVTRTSSLQASNIDYDDFMQWQKEKADEVDPDIREAVGDLEMQWADGGNTVRVIAYRDKNPIGFVVMNRFNDGHSISTLGLTSSARGGGVAGKIYDYIIGRTTLYSDVHQTPEARKLWLKLSKKYRVMGWQDGETFDVVPSDDGSELVAVDDDRELYSDEEGSAARLVVLGRGDLMNYRLPGIAHGG